MFKKKIWIVSELFYPETISTGYIMTEIAKSLNQDCEVEVICGLSFYETKSNQINSDSLGFKIHRVQNVKYNKNKIISRLIGNLRISWKMFVIMKNKIPSNSQILLVSNPIFLVWLISLIINSRKWKVKLLMHDVFPENLKSLENHSVSIKLAYPLLKKGFDIALSKMDTIISIGRDMNSLLINKVKHCSHVIIENWADVTNVSYSYYNEPKFIFLYAGNFGRVQGLDKLLEAISLVEMQEFKFLFIGSGASQNIIENFKKSQKKILVDILPWQPRESQDVFLSKATIGVVSLAAGMFGLGVPSKFYNLLASGKPIFYIGPIGSEIHLIMQQNRIGWFAESGNVAEIKKVIEEILVVRDEQLKLLSTNARHLAESQYSKKLILNKFKLLFS
jgi:glycosyltransferase involved in cell wall biosynthesis